MHDNAAGVQIPDKNLSAFHDWANKALAGIDFGENCYDVNFERIAADEDIQNIILDIGNHTGIWGQSNNEPVIHVTDINVTMDDVKIMGKNMDTVKIEKFGIVYMKFHAKDLIDDLHKYSKVKLEIVGRTNVSYWGGKVIPQIFIDDYEATDGVLGF